MSDKDRKGREPTMFWDGINPLIQGRVKLRYDMLIPLLAREAIKDFVLSQRVLDHTEFSRDHKIELNKWKEETYDGS